jgi:hypothetical protein
VICDAGGQAERVGQAPRFQRATETLWRRAGDHVLLLGPCRKEMLKLSGTGRALWSALDKPRTLAELADLLSKTYDTDLQTVMDDIRPTLDQLTEQRLVRCAEPA